MSTKRIALLGGDGIGREVVAAGEKILRRLVGDWELVAVPYSAKHTLERGVSITPEEMKALGEFDAILLGALGDPSIPDGHHAREILLGMRTQLDLYVNFRPCFALADALVPLKNRSARDIHFVVFRENTEGLYTGIGGSFKTGTPDEIAVEQEINTRKGVERILRAAFEFAAKSERKKLVMADKANAMSHGHGLWRRVFASLQREFSGVEARALYVDNLVFQMVRDPSQFEVIVTNNLFGDVVTDLAAALQGGLGLAASANYRPGGPAMFEPVHGSAPDIAGKGVANPMGAAGCVALLLHHLGADAAAKKLDAALTTVAANGPHTPDLGGKASTEEVTQAILALL